MNNHDNCPWMFPKYQWNYYGKILKDVDSYEEFVINCIIRGFVNPDQTKRSDKTIALTNRHEPYEYFIYCEACGYRGNGILNKKAAKFRDKIIEQEIENNERTKDGIVIF